LRDVDPEAEHSLLFVESDDSYLVILRLDRGEDLRVFGSDATFAEESRLGALLLGDVGLPGLELGTAEVDLDDLVVGPPDVDPDALDDADEETEEAEEQGSVLTVDL